MVDRRRIKELSPGSPGNGPVVYLMSRDHRVDDNWAVLFAQELALEHKQPLIVVCPIGIDYPYARQRQLDFLAGGLSEIESKLDQLNIPFYTIAQSTVTRLYELIRDVGACSVVTDFNPLRESRRWKSQLGDVIDIPFYEIDAHNVVPAWEASNKLEYAAYTIRPKILRRMKEFLTPFTELKRHPFTAKLSKVFDGWASTLTSDHIAAANTISFGWEPGETAALTHLNRFLSERLRQYNDYRNDPTRTGQSGLSPYLHSGQLSAQRVALEAQRYDADIAAQESFLEELIIRRELSDNFCLYNDMYDSFEGFPAWARKTLDEHRRHP
jgi:deoxyribodipyrimidine photo-lyase